MYPAVTNTVTNTACNGQGINGQLEVEKSVQSGKAWAAKKFQDFQARKLRVFSVFRSKFPYFPACLWAATAGKTMFRYQSKAAKLKQPTKS